MTYELKGKYSIIEDGVDIGEGTIVWNYVHVRSGSKIGKNCKIGNNVYIDKDVVIGDGVKIQNGVNIFKGVVLEDDVFVGPSVTFTNVRKPKASHVVPSSAYVSTLIKKGASIGANCTIICGAIIGEDCMIAAGCTVLSNQDVPDGVSAHGYPIKQFPRFQ